MMRMLNIAFAGGSDHDKQTVRDDNSCFAWDNTGQYKKDVPSQMYKMDPATIILQIEDAHQRTLALMEGLTAQQLMGPKLATVNPLRWEVGHLAYFYEYWVLRQHLGRPPLRADSDSLYDSISIAHDDRWDLPLPAMADTLAYVDTILKNVQACLSQGEDAQRDYLAQYAVFHHDMHNEAFTYTRQTLNYAAPCCGRSEPEILNAGGLAGDAHIPGGQFMLGASPVDGFVFDNEKWAHALTVQPFSIARAAVSNADYLEFVEEGGYRKPQLWSKEGWRWREQARLEQPVYWRRNGQDWQIKQFDEWHPLPHNAALIHVSWHEAQAYCRWAERRLPSELEWEVAASGQPSSDGKSLAAEKRYFPWGEHAPREDQANLNGYALGTVDVAAHAAGDSAFGCRQMIGNVWEWTQDIFQPYPGFVPDMYADYSQPLFGNTRVLRGGAWTTQARMIRNSWRTYYGVERNDVFAGFRTCSL